MTVSRSLFCVVEAMATVTIRPYWAPWEEEEEFALWYEPIRVRTNDDWFELSQEFKADRVATKKNIIGMMQQQCLFARYQLFLEQQADWKEWMHHYYDEFVCPETKHNVGSKRLRSPMMRLVVAKLILQRPFPPPPMSRTTD